MTQALCRNICHLISGRIIIYIKEIRKELWNVYDNYFQLIIRKSSVLNQFSTQILCKIPKLYDIFNDLTIWTYVNWIKYLLIELFKSRKDTSNFFNNYLLRKDLES